MVRHFLLDICTPKPSLKCITHDIQLVVVDQSCLHTRLTGMQPSTCIIIVISSYFSCQEFHPPCLSCFAFKIPVLSIMFGVYLLNDLTGSRMLNIEDECCGNTERIMVRVLQEWLEGKGLPLKWQSLIQTLRDTDLSDLAEKIEAKL